MTRACHVLRMPRRKQDEDFNTQIHAMYERIADGESSHDDEPPAEPAPTPEKTEQPKKAPGSVAWTARRQEGRQRAAPDALALLAWSVGNHWVASFR